MKPRRSVHFAVSVWTTGFPTVEIGNHFRTSCQRRLGGRIIVIDARIIVQNKRFRAAPEWWPGVSRPPHFMLKVEFPKNLPHLRPSECVLIDGIRDKRTGAKGRWRKRQSTRRLKSGASSQRRMT